VLVTISGGYHLERSFCYSLFVQSDLPLPMLTCRFCGFCTGAESTHPESPFWHCDPRPVSLPPNVQRRAALELQGEAGASDRDGNDASSREG